MSAFLRFELVIDWAKAEKPDPSEPMERLRAFFGDHAVLHITRLTYDADMRTAQIIGRALPGVVDKAESDSTGSPHAVALTLHKAGGGH